MVKRSRYQDVRRGDIIKVSFDPTVGHEQAGYRPALVVSDKTFHTATGFALCLPITSKKKGLLFEVDVASNEITGVVLPHGARMLDLKHRDFVRVDTIQPDALRIVQSILAKILTE